MKRAFTLIDILITLVIILILSTISMVSYNYFLEKARQKVCETNIQTLLMAVKMYVIRHDRFPASVGSLEPEDIGKAYAKVMRQGGWSAKLSRYFVKLNTPRRAYADIDSLDDLMNPNEMRQHGVEPSIFKCPAAPHPPSPGKGHDEPPGFGDDPGDIEPIVSYGINKGLGELNPYTGETMRWEDVSPSMIIIGDCISYKFQDPKKELDKRHGGGKFAHGITGDGDIVIVDTEGNINCK